MLAPRPEHPHLLYISHIESAMAAVLTQAYDLGRERHMYFLSQVIHHTEQRYIRMEKACLALIFQKLHHYFVNHAVYLIVHDNPVWWAAQWLLNPMEFDIKCVTQKAMKGQALVELTTAHPS